jgi:hypothetical protein
MSKTTASRSARSASTRPKRTWRCGRKFLLHLVVRELPRVVVPADLSKRWILESIEAHPERRAWREVPDGPGGLVSAADGALVLMAHLRFPAHIDVWLQPEARRHPLQRSARRLL